MTASGFIASVGTDKQSALAASDFPWFILRARQNRPYDALEVGDPLYWYDPIEKTIFLSTRITKVAQVKYETVDDLSSWLSKHYGEHASMDHYFLTRAPKCRYCVAFWVHTIQPLDLPKPPECNLDRDGWLPCDSNAGRLWLSSLNSIDPDGNHGAKLRSTAEQLSVEGYFDPKNLNDERERRLQEVVQRRGQPEFRAALIEAYGSRCAVTDCDAVSALEAAHITPYLGPKTNHVSNGLLLRADIHTLFDLDLIGIAPDSHTISVAPAIKATVYAALDGQKLLPPTNAANIPNQEALAQRWGRFVGEKDGAG